MARDRLGSVNKYYARLATGPERVLDVDRALSCRSEALAPAWYRRRFAEAPNPTGTDAYDIHEPR